MPYVSLVISALCTFAALYHFNGSFLNALNAALAVITFGLFIIGHSQKACKKN
jgi:hypothetical protein